MPYFASGVGSRQKFDAIVTGAFQPAASKWSRDLYLADCLDVPGSIYGLAQPPATRQRMLEACNANARDILRTTPNASNAWVVLAVTSAELGDFETMRTALSMSKRTAPNLQWLADRRTRLAEGNATELDAASTAVYESDIAVLASGDIGVKVLAQRYARSPELRDTYIRVLETVAPRRKRAFLAAVRTEMGS